MTALAVTPVVRQIQAADASWLASHLVDVKQHVAMDVLQHVAMDVLQHVSHPADAKLLVAADVPLQHVVAKSLHAAIAAADVLLLLVAAKSLLAILAVATLVAASHVVVL